MRWFLSAVVALAVAMAGCGSPSGPLCPPAGPAPPGCPGGPSIPSGAPSPASPPAPGRPTSSPTAPTPEDSSPPSPTPPAPVAPAVYVPENVSMHAIVSVPWWTEGGVMLVPEAGEPVPLQRTGEVFFEGNVTLVEGATYRYATTNASEVPTRRQARAGEAYDGVVAWEGDARPFGKEGFQQSFYLGACHTCGVSYTKGNFLGPMNGSMDRIRDLGGTWVDLVPVWFVEPDFRGSRIAPIFAPEFAGESGWIHATIADADLVALVDAAHARGLRVYLAPHVSVEDWGPGVPAKGDLEPADPDAFFADYRRFIGHYAEIAERSGVEMLSIGNELDTLTDPENAINGAIGKEARWRDVIRHVRERYTGTLTYSASCIAFDGPGDTCTPQRIPFWDALDVVGWEWYTPIATGPHEPIVQMRANAAAIVERIDAFSLRVGKPVVLTEVGWEAYAGACASTYGVGPSKGGDRVEQASCYEALFQALQASSSVTGMHAWTWTASLPGDRFLWVATDSANEVRFSVTEGQFAKWYGLIAP